MATVINNPSSSPTVERTIETTGDSSAGWAVAVIVLLAVVAAGAFFLMRGYQAPAAAPDSNGGANINVTLPASDSGSTPAPSSGGTQQPAPAQ